MARLTYRRRLELQVWAGAHAFDPQWEPPGDWPSTFRLGPAGLIPTYCGDHAPGFVGLYAIINALALLLADVEPLRPKEERMLLDLGWSFLASRGVVAPWHGIRTSCYERLAASLAYALSRRRAQWVRCERLELLGARGEELGAILERLILARQAVIILLGKGHYTVLRGYTPLSWLMFDCTGRMWMKRDRQHLFAEQGWRRSAPFVMALSRAG